MEEYSGYWDTPIFEEEYNDRSESTFYQTYKFCLEPTLYEIFPHLWKLLLINCIFRFATQISIFPINQLKYK